MKTKLEVMRKQANKHQMQMDEMVSKLPKSDDLNSSKIQEVAQETQQKASRIMENQGEGREGL